MQLLLIEEHRRGIGWLEPGLRQAGFRLVCAPSSALALQTRGARCAEGLILDAAPGEGAATRAVRTLRAGGLDQPLLVLSEQGHWREKVDCLDAGADDYLVKPVRSEEVAARLRAIIRRSAGSAHDRIVAGDVVLDLRARTASLGGEPLALTRNEFRLLRAFVLRAGHVLSHEEIRDLLYADSADRSLNAIEVHIARLRRKIGRGRIRTVRGLGYAIDVSEGARNGLEPHLAG